MEKSVQWQKKMFLEIKHGEPVQYRWACTI